MADLIQKGNTCHLRFAGQRIAAEVVDVREQLIRLRCPENGVPARGRGLTVEFKDSIGTAGFFAQVVTTAPGDLHEVVLMRSPGLDRIELRNHLRVPASLLAAVSGPQSSSAYRAEVVNLSTGGLLLETRANLDVGDTVQLAISAEDKRELHIAGAVVHTYPEQTSDRCRVGIRYLAPDQAFLNSISWYVWRRVEQVFPAYSGT